MVAFWWLVDPHHYWLAPAASGLAPAFCVGLASPCVDLGALPADCDGSSAVALVRRDELDAVTHSQASALLANDRLGNPVDTCLCRTVIASTDCRC
jgi:hypothetical protein